LINFLFISCWAVLILLKIIFFFLSFFFEIIIPSKLFLFMFVLIVWKIGVTHIRIIIVPVLIWIKWLFLAELFLRCYVWFNRHLIRLIFFRLYKFKFDILILITQIFLLIILFELFFHISIIISLLITFFILIEILIILIIYNRIKFYWLRDLVSI